MTETKRKRKRLIAIVVLLLVIAWLCRVSRSGNVRGWVRCTIQCGLLAAWAVSVQKRIINRKVRGYLTLIATLFIFWTVEVMVKYTILPPYPTLTRYAWYLYYIPMTLAPVFTLFSALYVGRPEGYQIDPRWDLLLIPAFACMALMLTNDLHQLSFSFPDGIPNAGDDYTQGVGFYITMGIVLLEALAFFTVLLKKCRLAEKGRRVLLPFVPILCLLVYAAIYVIDYDRIAVVAGDMKSVNVYAIVLTLELCIYTGLLPSNTHYEELFAVSTVHAQITDEEYRTLLRTDAEPALPPEAMRQTQNAPVMLSGSVRLSGKPIEGGYVLWTEDLSELTEIVSELQELEEELTEKEYVLREEYETRHRHHRLVERNRLYNRLQDQTEQQLRTLSQRIGALKRTEDAAELHRLTAEVAVLTAYIKRRNNLFFLSEEHRLLSPEELGYCLKESLDNLSLFGADCQWCVQIEEMLSFETVMALYDAFEAAAELAMDSLEELFVSVSRRGGAPALSMSLVCAADLVPLSGCGFQVVREDEREWTVEYICAEGGENG